MQICVLNLKEEEEGRWFWAFFFLKLCYKAKNTYAVEKVQRQAARFVTNNYGWDTSVTKLLN